MVTVSSAVPCTWMGEVRLVVLLEERLGDWREMAVTVAYATD
jgi:hypothetical protein